MSTAPTKIRLLIEAVDEAAEALVNIHDECLLRVGIPRSPKARHLDMIELKDALIKLGKVIEIRESRVLETGQIAEDVKEAINECGKIADKSGSQLPADVKAMWNDLYKALTGVSNRADAAYSARGCESEDFKGGLTALSCVILLEPEEVQAGSLEVEPPFVTKDAKFTGSGGLMAFPATSADNDSNSALTPGSYMSEMQGIPGTESMFDSEGVWRANIEVLRQAMKRATVQAQLSLSPGHGNDNEADIDSELSQSFDKVVSARALVITPDPVKGVLTTYLKPSSVIMRSSASYELDPESSTGFTVDDVDKISSRLLSLPLLLSAGGRRGGGDDVSSQWLPQMAEHLDKLNL